MFACDQGPVTVISGKKRRLTLVECNNDINSMLDIAKVRMSFIFKEIPNRKEDERICSETLRIQRMSVQILTHKSIIAFYTSIISCFLPINQLLLFNVLSYLLILKNRLSGK
jgi:hypothetical protein